MIDIQWSKVLEDDLQWVPLREAEEKIERQNQLLSFITKDCHKASDEIERLRSEIKENELIVRGASRATEEIGLLRSEHLSDIKALARLHNIIGTQEGEIERLRDLVTRLSTLVDTERSLHDEEIKRLCDENSRLKQEICSQGLNWAKDAAEITQLRSDIVALQGMRQNAEAEVERLTAQAQRDYDHQQAQITRLNDLIDTERKHHSEWQKMAQEEIHGWMRKEAKLRELRANDDRIIKHFRSLHDETR